MTLASRAGEHSVGVVSVGVRMGRVRGEEVTRGESCNSPYPVKNDHNYFIHIALSNLQYRNNVLLHVMHTYVINYGLDLLSQVY